MGGLKPIKAQQKNTGPTKRQKKILTKPKALVNESHFAFENTLNYQHAYGPKPLPEGGIEFFEKSNTMWRGTWNARLNRTAFAAKVNGWLKDEFIEIFRNNVPDPDDPECLAVINCAFNSKESASDGNDRNDGKKAFKDLLIKDIACEIETFHTTDQIPFARLKNQQSPNVIAIRGSMFEGFVKKCIYEKRNATLNKSLLEEIVSHFDAYALHRSKPEKIYLRVAKINSDVILCLGGESGCIRIFPNHSTDISVQGFEAINTTKANFIKSKGSGNIPPIVYSDIFPIKNVINELFEKFINIKIEEDRILLLAALVSYLMAGKGDFIFLIFEGEQGSGKTTAMEFAKMLIDPSPIEKNLLPKKEKDIYMIAQHLFVLGFDNVSGISKEISDCLCALSTGGAIMDRALYTNQDLNVLSAKCPVMINGIEASPDRADLLDRSVIFNIDSLQTHRSKEKMYEEFNESSPHILMALIQMTSYALARSPEIEDFGSFRMTDYAKAGCAVAEYLGYPKEFFINAYRANKDKSSKAILENDIVARQLLSCLRPGEKFVGTATKLYERIKPHEFDLSKLFPRGPSPLSKSLRRIAPELRKQKFIINLEERASDYREIEIQMPPEENSIWSKLNSKNPQAQRQFGSPNGGPSEDFQ